MEGYASRQCVTKHKRSLDVETVNDFPFTVSAPVNIPL